MFAQLQSKAAALGEAAKKAAEEAADLAAKEAARLKEEAQKHANEIRANVTDIAQGFQGSSQDEPLKIDVEFPEGLLGFDLEGTRIAVVEAGGLGEQLGVKVGDNLYAIAGDVIPDPPATDSAAEAEQRVKKYIRKRIKEKPRPVKLTFTRVVVAVEEASPPNEDNAGLGAELDEFGDDFWEGFNLGKSASNEDSITATTIEASAKDVAESTVEEPVRHDEVAEKPKELCVEEQTTAVVEEVDDSFWEGGDGQDMPHEKVDELPKETCAAEPTKALVEEVDDSFWEQGEVHGQDEAQQEAESPSEGEQKRVAEETDAALAEVVVEEEHITTHEEQPAQEVIRVAEEEQLRDSEEPANVAMSGEEEQVPLEQRQEDDEEAEEFEDEEIRSADEQAALDDAFSEAQRLAEEKEVLAKAAEEERRKTVEEEQEKQKAEAALAQAAEEERLLLEQTVAVDEQNELDEEERQLAVDAEGKEDCIVADDVPLPEQGSVEEDIKTAEEVGLEAASEVQVEQRDSTESYAEGDDLRKELQRVNEELVKTRKEMKSKEEEQMKSAKALQEKVLSAVQRVKEQEKKKGEAVVAELRDERAETARLKSAYSTLQRDLVAVTEKRDALVEELASLRANSEQIASANAVSEERAAELNESLERARSDLRVSTERARRAERELDQSKTEFQTLMNSSSMRDDRIEVAQKLLEGKLSIMQEQLDAARGETEVMRQKNVKLHEELSTSKAECHELRLASKRFEDERQFDLESHDHRAQALEAELSRSREEAITLEGKLLSSAKQAEESEARIAQMTELLEEKTFELKSATNKASAVTMELQQLREYEFPRLREDAEKERLEAEKERLNSESHKQLVRALQERLIEQETDFERKLETLRQEAADGSSSRRHSMLDGLGSCDDIPDGVGEDDDDIGGHTAFAKGDPISQDDDTQVDVAPPEAAGREEIARLHGRIQFLENRCRTIQKKLDARPIVFQGPQQVSGDNPLGLEDGMAQTSSGRSAWETAASSVTRSLNLPQGSELRLFDACASICYYIDQPLRNFTQRLLKRDAWLLVFYAHLLVMYLIVADCMAGSTLKGDSASPGQNLEKAFQKAALETSGG